MWSINSDLLGNKFEESVNDSTINEVIEQVQQELKAQLNDVFQTTEALESKYSTLESRLVVVEEKLGNSESKFEALQKKMVKMMLDQDD